MHVLQRRRAAVIQAQQAQREKADRRARIDSELMSVLSR